MRERVGQRSRSGTLGDTSKREAQPEAADALEQLRSLRADLGRPLATAVMAGQALSSSELGRMLNVLPSMTVEQRGALYAALREAHAVMGSIVPAPAGPEVTMGELLELAATAAVPLDLDAANAAIARNDAAIRALESGPNANQAGPELKRLATRGQILAQYERALHRPSVNFIDGWKVAAQRVGRELERVEAEMVRRGAIISMQPRHEELAAAHQRLLARSALENDPRRRLAGVPMLGQRLLEVVEGKGLEPHEVATFHGTAEAHGLVDLSPAQRKALLKIVGQAVGEDLLPPRLLKLISRPVDADRIIKALSMNQRFPIGAAALAGALAEAKALLAEATRGVDALLAGGASDALPPTETKQLAALKTKQAYTRARVDELTVRLAHEQKGWPPMRVEPWPSTTRGVSAAIGRVQLKLGDLRERVIHEGPRLKAGMEREIEVLEARKRSLETLHAELAEIPLLSAWKATGAIVAINGLVFDFPKVFNTFASIGVVREPADRLTQKNVTYPYAIAGVSTAFGGAARTHSKPVKGWSTSFTPVPLTSIGTNPLMGEYVSFGIPGAYGFGLALSANGSVSSTFFLSTFGLRTCLRNEAFTHVTQPMLEVVIWGAKKLGAFAEPVRLPIEDATRPLFDKMRAAVERVRETWGTGRA